MSAPQNLTCSCGDCNETVEMRNTEDGFMEMCDPCFNTWNLVSFQVNRRNEVYDAEPVIQKVVKRLPQTVKNEGYFLWHTMPSPAMPWCDMKPIIGKTVQCYDIKDKERKNLIELFPVHFSDGLNTIDMGYYSGISVSSHCATVEACKRLMFVHHHTDKCRKCKNKNKIVNDRPEGLRNNWHRYCDKYMEIYDKLEMKLQEYILDIQPLLYSSGLMCYIKRELYYNTDRHIYCASRLINSRRESDIKIQQEIESLIGKPINWDDFVLVCEYYCQIFNQNPTEFNFLAQ